jgi:hypothetical protein
MKWSNGQFRETIPKDCADSTKERLTWPFINSRLMEEDIDLITGLLDGFGVLSLDEDFISCFRRGGFSAVNEDFPGAITLDGSAASNLRDLEYKLCQYRQSENESNLWTSLRSRGVFPVFIATLAFSLLSKETDLYCFGLTLYSVLLGMEPSSTIWNLVLFHPILSALISAQQLLDQGGTLDDANKETLDQAGVLLANLAVACTQEFLEMIDRDVLIAVAEICVKLTTGLRPEFENFNVSLADASAVCIGRIAETQLGLLLPFSCQRYFSNLPQIQLVSQSNWNGYEIAC